MTTTYDMSHGGERDAGLARAVETLRAGGIVAIPTETVYGLAADATNGEAVARIYEIKGRPQFNPLIVHVPSREAAERIAMFGPLAVKLAETLWPGPLTLVLPKKGSGVADLVTAGLDTIAVRMPAHAAAQAVLRALGRPIAAPSANRSGRVSPTTAAHVATDLGSDIGVILDGGPAAVGLESTIVAVDGERLTLLRHGGIPREEVERVSGRRLDTQKGDVRAPGMLASHYAPSAALRLGATSVAPGEALLAFGGTRIPGSDEAVATRNLSPSADLRQAAAHLFGALRELDAFAAPIAVAPIPDVGLGVAINDRLRRAAAPRE